uniref:Gustatory receptor n=1 Tax=Culicoides sonorensis TaxID=179676 RepID=A0A336LSC5_CULSO
MARINISSNSFKSRKNNLRKIIKLDQNPCFYETSKYVFAFAQIFAVMPLTGLWTKSHDLNGLKFKWMSFNTIYSIFCIISIGAMCVIAASSTVAQYGLKIGKISPLVFYVVNWFSLIQFLFLAVKWPSIMLYWKKVENNLPKCKKRAFIGHSIKFFAIFVICFSFVEHSMSIFSNLINVLHCPQEHSITEAFFRSHMGFIFNIIDYNLFLALFSKWMNIISTFTWSFMDLFIIMIALGLSNMFRRLNDFIFRQDYTLMDEDFWAEQRRSYRKICDLISEVDNATSTITLISFTNNLFFICLQLLNSLIFFPLNSSQMPRMYEIYFWFSLSFLITRTCLIIITCSFINEESRKPLLIFRKIPSTKWCLEVKRFFTEIATSNIGLTGKRYFRVTRGLLLSITGTIITYELILFNFNQDEDQKIEDCVWQSAVGTIWSGNETSPVGQGQ